MEGQNFFGILVRVAVAILALVIIYYIVRWGWSKATASSTVETAIPVPAENAYDVQEQQSMSELAAEGPTYDLASGADAGPVRPNEEPKSQLYDYNYQVLPYPQIASSPTDSYFMSGGICQPSDPSCYSGSILQAPDLLPQDIGSNAWNETSPKAQGTITDQNFLESGHHVGINTVGQSLKNPNTQLRSDPPIPKVNVGPWYNSTIDPDTNRKVLEIGS